MKKRLLCLLTAAMLILLILPIPAMACDHTDENGEPLKYVKKGYVAPQIGKQGFSGDLCCPKCGAVVIPGKTLAALEEPAGPGSTGQTEKPKQTAAPGPTKVPKITDKPKTTAKPKNTQRPSPGAKKPAKQGGTPEAEPVKRERFSLRYPYRRIRMQMNEDLLAESAGILIWPVAGSPFQSLFD